MKVKRLHLQLAVGALVLAVAWSLYSYTKSLGRTAPPVGPAAAASNQPPLLSREQPVPSQPTIDPLGIPAPPSIAGAYESTSPRDPFLFGSEDRNVKAVVVPVGANPTVQAILFAASRRLAIVDSRVVRVGDHLGDFTVVQIERDAVSFRIPSGERRRVAVRPQPFFGARQ